MTRQYDFHRSNESSQKDDDNWILQRSAVRSLPAKTLTPQTKSTAGDRSGMKLDLMQIPVSNHSANPSPLQALAQRDGETPVQRQEEEKKAENKTGLPDGLKEGIESLSGFDLSGVRVNYNSPKPAQLNAHAYTQGQKNSKSSRRDATPGMVGYDTYKTIADPSVGNGIQLGIDILFLGMEAGMRLSEGGREYAEVGGCASFVAGTEVATSQGEKAIEEVAVGDTVLAYNEETGEEGEYPVTHLFTRIAPESIVVTVGEEEITTTPEHEFYTSNGWVEAQDLALGDELVQRGGNTMTVTALESGKSDVRVYNFEVDQVHDYYVSERELLVHNGKCSKRTARMGATPSKKSRTGKEVIERWAGISKAKYKGKVTKHPTKAQLKDTGNWTVSVRKTAGGNREWVKLDRNIHMGHKLSAAEAWTFGAANFVKSKPKYAKRYSPYMKKLSASGQKSKLVRDFMKDPANYRFEWGPLNSSQGSGGIQYFP